MTREQSYYGIIERMHLPENREKYDAINKSLHLCVEDELIKMHLSHIRDYLKVLSRQENEQIIISCDAELRSLELLLNKRGWK